MVGCVMLYLRGCIERVCVYPLGHVLPPHDLHVLIGCVIGCIDRVCDRCM